MSTVLVTGANRGLGFGLVSQLLLRPKSAYPSILAAARQADRGSELARLADKSEGRVKPVKLDDVGDMEACRRAVEEVKGVAPDGVHILINNAGYAFQPPLRLTTHAGALDLRRTILTNALGPLFLATALLEASLLAASPSRPPVIVNMTSSQASLSFANEMWEGGQARDDLFFHPIYASSKVALTGVTLHLARDLRDKAIVGAIHPGWVQTEMGRKYAYMTADESAAKVLDVMEGWKTLKDTAQFVDWENRKLRW